MATNWQGCEPATDGVTQYYVYNVFRGKWLVDQQTYNGQDFLGAGGSYKGQALADVPVAWTLNGSLDGGYKMQSSNGHFFAVFDRGWGSRVVTSEDDSTNKNTKLKSALVDGVYSIYTNEKVGSTGRNIFSSSDTRLEVQADASYEWRFVSMQEYADSMRTFNEYAETVCESELPYVDAHFSELNEAGEYRDTIVNVAGFDSVLVFTLTINAIERITLDTLYGHVGEELAIFGQPVVFNAAIDTVLYDTLVASNGCDSILIQPVVIEESIVTALSESVRADKATKFLENGILYMLKGDALYDMRGQRLR